MRKSKNRYFLPHSSFPWGHRWGNHAKCCMDGKRIRCLQIVPLHVPIYLLPFLRYSEIFVKKSSFYHAPLAFDAPVRGVTVGISASPLGWNGVATRWWKNFEDIFIRFDVIHERDRRTDGQTDRQTLRDSIDRACIASCGNDQLEINMHHLPKAMQYRQALWAILTKFCVLWDSYRSALLSKISTLWV